MFVNTVPKGKDISSGAGEALVAAHESEKGYETISKQFGLGLFYSNNYYPQVESHKIRNVN